jgi:hypothetical protein
MIHLGYVYATERPPWPPEDPYLAGTPLYYPWVYHALVGRISSLLDEAPSWIIAGCNLAALAVTIVVVAGISRLLDGDAITANCAVVLAVLAPTVMGPGLEPVFNLLLPPGIPKSVLAAFWDGRALPPTEKYLNTAPMALGIAVTLIVLYESLRVLQPSRAGAGALPGLAGPVVALITSIILAGYIYPFLWISACLIVVACAAVAAWAGEGRKLGALIAALVLGNLAVVPYLLALTRGRAAGHGFGLQGDPRLVLARLLHVVIVLLPLWLLIGLRRQSLSERLRARSWAHWAALGSGLVLLLTFILLDARTADVGVGYKFRTMAVFCLAPLAAPGLKWVSDRNRPALVLLLGLQLLPFCSDSATRIPGRWGRVTEPYSWHGAQLRHAIPAEEDLYRWIREHTPATAVLIDQEPYGPVYAQRSLLVARRSRRMARESGPEAGWLNDGWLFHPSVWLDQVNGHPAAEIRHRNELVDGLYHQTDARSVGDLARQLGAMTADRPVFVVARNGLEKAALEGKPFLQKVAEASDWAVYALEKHPS